MPARILGDFKCNHYYNCRYQRFQTEGNESSNKEYYLIITASCLLYKDFKYNIPKFYVIRPSINIPNSNVKVKNISKVMESSESQTQNLPKLYAIVIINITHVHCMHKHDNITLVYFIHQPDKNITLVYCKSLWHIIYTSLTERHSGMIKTSLTANTYQIHGKIQ